jgi:hypothetical protein
MSDPIYFVAWFYRQRGGAEHLIKGANNDASLAAHSSGRFDLNGNHFQLAMLAYNLNCWLMLFNREPQADVTELKHTTLAISTPRQPLSDWYRLWRAPDLARGANRGQK